MNITNQSSAELLMAAALTGGWRSSSLAVMHLHTWIATRQSIPLATFHGA